MWGWRGRGIDRILSGGVRVGTGLLSFVVISSISYYSLFVLWALTRLILHLASPHYHLPPAHCPLPAQFALIRAVLIALALPHPPSTITQHNP